jgi:hypothetical protein
VPVSTPISPYDRRSARRINRLLGRIQGDPDTRRPTLRVGQADLSYNDPNGDDMGHHVRKRFQPPFPIPPRFPIPVVGRASAWYPFPMEPPRHILRVLTRLGRATKELAGKLRRAKRSVEPAPAMIGLPPSARGLTGRPAGIAEHASELAREWEDVVEVYVQKTMRELGIADDRIGAPDYERGGDKRAFLPDETKGGTNDEWGRLYVDSGVLNPELNAEAIGPEAEKLWAEARVRDRIKAVIPHEDPECRGIPHDEAVQLAPENELPIGDNARKIRDSSVNTTE